MEQSVSSGQIPPMKKKLGRITGRTKTRFATSTPTTLISMRKMPLGQFRIPQPYNSLQVGGVHTISSQEVDSPGIPGWFSPTFRVQ